MDEFIDIKNQTRPGVELSLRSEMLPQTSRNIFFNGCISAQRATNVPWRQNFSGQEKLKCQKQTENVQPVDRKQNITKMLVRVPRKHMCAWNFAMSLPKMQQGTQKTGYCNTKCTGSLLVAKSRVHTRTEMIGSLRCDPGESQCQCAMLGRLRQAISMYFGQ